MTCSSCALTAAREPAVEQVDGLEVLVICSHSMPDWASKCCLPQVSRASQHLYCNRDAHSAADLGIATNVGAILAPAAFSLPTSSIVPHR